MAFRLPSWRGSTTRLRVRLKHTTPRISWTTATQSAGMVCSILPVKCQPTMPLHCRSAPVNSKVKRPGGCRTSSKMRPPSPLSKELCTSCTICPDQTIRKVARQLLKFTICRRSRLLSSHNLSAAHVSPTKGNWCAPSCRNKCLDGVNGFQHLRNCRTRNICA
jgi:hypothetical protein